MTFLLFFFSSSLHLINSCIPTSPAAMPPIPCQNCPSFPNTGFASESTSVDANTCVTRTLNCGSATSTRTIIKYNGATDITGTGTLKFTVTCSVGNSAWLYMGTPITQAECSERKILKSGQRNPASRARHFLPRRSLQTAIANGCAVRTLTCGASTSTKTLIKYNGVTDIPGTGPLTFAVTCNDANTAWLYMGTVITQAACSEPCQSCPTFPVTSFASDSNNVVNGCAVRTLTCGASTSMKTLIKYNGVTDIPGTGPLTFAVTCNDANTAWLYMGTVITQAECSEPCQLCPTLPATGFASKVPSTDANRCRVQRLTCGGGAGTFNWIQYNGATNTARSMSSSSFAVTCNIANTAWVYSPPTGASVDISQLQCNNMAGGQSCTPFPVSGSIDSETYMVVNGCRVRTLFCPAGGSKSNPNTKIWVVFGSPPGFSITSFKMDISMFATCNAAGEWIFVPPTGAARPVVSVNSCSELGGGFLVCSTGTIG